MEKMIEKMLYFLLFLLFFAVFNVLKIIFEVICNSCQVSFQKNYHYGIIKYRSFEMCLLCRSFNTINSESLLDITN